jgi:hypothetical protein
LIGAEGRGKCGAIAQLGERYNGIVEVTGSIPVGSTNKIKGFAGNGEALRFSGSTLCQHAAENRLPCRPMLLRALSPAAVALLNHPPDACRWPLDDAWCCQRATHGSAYCREHRERARWRPVAVQPDDAEGAKSAGWVFDRAGIVLPMMYRLGFNNANCIGCVQAQSPAYWNRTRRHFPEDFARRARLSRELGVRLVKLTTGARERIFLDELDPNMGAGEVEPHMDCSLLCYIAEQTITAE